MTSDLKPCPFCGGEAIQCGDNEWTSRHWIMCRNCHASPKGTVRELSLAIEAWNTRPEEDRLRAENKRLKEALVRLHAGNERQKAVLRSLIRPRMVTHGGR